MKIQIAATTLVSYLISCLSLCAQPTPNTFDLYTIEQGLINNEISDAVQDEDGFMWIATRGGLNRFDGKDFVSFPRGNSKRDFSFEEIARVRNIGGHRLIIGSTKGLVMLHTQTGVAQRLTIPSKEELSTYTNHITDIAITNEGKIVAISLGGLYIFNDDLQLEFRHDAYTAADINKKRIAFAYELSQMRDGKIIIESTEGILMLNPKKKSFEKIDERLDRILNLPHTIIGWSEAGLCVQLDRANRQLVIADPFRDLIFTSSTPSNFANEIEWKSRITFVNDSTFFISSSRGNGLFLFSIDKLKKTVIYKDQYFDGIQCNRVFNDGEHRLWVGTDAGLYKQSFCRSAFHSVNTNLFSDRKDVEDYVTGFAETGNTVWVSDASQGILSYNETDHSLKQIIPVGEHTLTRPWSLTRFTTDSLLVQTQHGALALNTINNKWRRFKHSTMPAMFDSVAITSALLDSRNQLWMGLGRGQGVLMIDRNTYQWKQFKPTTIDKGFPLRYPLSITEDKWGVVWMTGQEGITRWNPKREMFDTLITKIPGLTDEITGHWISALADKDGNLWICPEAFVLIRWNIEQNQMKIFRAPAKEGSFYARKIGGPWHNRLWFPTNVGLLSFNITEEKFTMLKKFDGLPEENVWQGGIYFNPHSARMYVGLGKQFIWFNPSDILRKKKSIPTLITDVSVLGDSTVRTLDGPLKFSHQNNFISISFTGINHDNGQSNVYAYRLIEDKPTRWIDVGGQKTINFANLKPGQYTFEVKAMPDESLADESIARLKFTISPAYYQTWWFYSLCALAISTMIYSLYRYRINQLVHVQRVRNTISSDLHDDIGARLTNLNILALLSKQNIHQSETAGKYISRMADEIQSSSQALDDIVWNINSTSDSLAEMVARMRRYAADLFENAQTGFSFYSDKDLNQRNMPMEQRRDLFLVYKEAIANIQKHANASDVQIHFSINENRIRLVIRDNGRGFDTQQPTHRNGLKNMRHRVEKWNGTLMTSSIPQMGTTLTILIP